MTIHKSNTRLFLAAALMAVFSTAVPLRAAEQNLSAWDEEHGAETYLATLPLTLGWFDGQPNFYISTDASDAAVAAAFGANYSPTLGNVANTTAVDDIYVITNFKQGNIVPSSPLPAGTANTNAAYSPFWQISMVTWAESAKPYLLRSEADVLAMRDAGQVTIQKTNIVVNCAVIYTPQGDVLPGSHISLSREVGANSVTKATLPLALGWFNGRQLLYTSTDASDAGAGGPASNLSLAIGNAANGNGVDDLYAVTNFKQSNVVPSAPSPTGPHSKDGQYTPAWQVSMVTWMAGKKPYTLTSEAAVLAAKKAGLVTIKKTDIIVNCSIVSSPTGGTLPGVTIRKSN